MSLSRHRTPEPGCLQLRQSFVIASSVLHRDTCWPDPALHSDWIGLYSALAFRLKEYEGARLTRLKRVGNRAVCQ